QRVVAEELCGISLIPFRYVPLYLTVSLYLIDGEQPMTISFELPRDIAEQANGTDLTAKAKEALLVELYREEKITQHQLAEALGLDDYETDGLLKQYGVGLGLSLEEFEGQRAFLQR